MFKWPGGPRKTLTEVYSLKYLFVYWKVRIFKCSYRSYASLPEGISNVLLIYYALLTSVENLGTIWPTLARLRPSNWLPVGWPQEFASGAPTNGTNSEWSLEWPLRPHPEFHLSNGSRATDPPTTGVSAAGRENPEISMVVWMGVFQRTRHRWFSGADDQVNPKISQKTHEYPNDCPVILLWLSIITTSSLKLIYP